MSEKNDKYKQRILRQVDKTAKSAPIFAKNVHDLLNMLPPDKKQAITAKAEKDPQMIFQLIMDALEELGITWKHAQKQ
jgi:hypothetical protein